MNQRNRKAVAYVRISSTMQKDNESPETQRTKIQEYADANGIEIIEGGWFFDEAKSGKNADREELNNLLTFALNHREKIDHVIVYKMSRASRDITSYYMQIKGVLMAKGITLRSATEQFDDSSTGKFMELIYVGLAQMDNDSKREYTIDNMTSLSKQGYYQHPPPVGYDNAKIPNSDGKLRPSLKPNSMAPKVKQVLERFSQGDISKAELTRYAHRVGLRSRYGTFMSEDSINRLLGNATYAGLIRDKFTDYQLFEAKHEGLINRATYELNQVFLHGSTTRKDEVHKHKNEKYVLKHTLMCFGCDNPLYASAPRTGNGGHSPRYHCGRGCKSPSIKADLVHDDFANMLKSIKPTEGVLRLYKQVLIQEANRALGTLNGRISTVRDELDDIARRRTNGIEMFADGQLTVSEKDDLLQSLDKKKLDTTLKLSELEQLQRIRETDIEAAVNFMGSVDMQWLHSDFDNRLRFQNMLFPQGVKYDLKNRRFGTSKISPLYKAVSKEKIPEHNSGISTTFLVAGAGLEPATLWL